VISLLREFSTVKMKTGMVLALVAALAAPLLGATGAHSATAGKTVCGQWERTPIQDGRYEVNNDRWGDNTYQCIQATDTGFVGTQMNHVNTGGAPGAYPSIQFGCAYGHCTKDSGLPVAVSDPAFKKLRTAVSVNTVNAGIWNSSYDIWFDPTSGIEGNPTGLELMIWFGHYGGSIRPLGEKVATVEMMGSTWDVWYGKAGRNWPWMVASYVRHENSKTADFALTDVYDDLLKRGYAKSSWYLRSIQAGFEIWNGQKGLDVNSFTVTSDAKTAGGGVISGPKPSPSRTPVPSPTSPPTAPPVPPATPSSGDHRCQSTVTVPVQWDGGYLLTTTVTNGARAPHDKWWSRVTLPTGQSVGGAWNGKTTDTKGPIGVSNEFYNGVLLPGTSTTWGMVVLRPRGTNTVATDSSCNLR
jgi:hypothetical protein